MNRTALTLYHALPAAAQSLVASAQGARLRWRRYGGRFAALAEEIRARSSWDSAAWHEHQRRELRRLLRLAAAEVPLYAAYWRRHDASREELASWPILEKEVLRRRPEALLRHGRRRRLIAVATSGTTGTPLVVRRARETEQLWYAMLEVRGREPWGVSWRDRWANLGGRLVRDVTARRPPYWVVDRGLRQLYMSSYHLADDTAPAYLEALAAFRPVYLLGYTSSLHTLARATLDAGTVAHRPRVAIANAEPVLAHQREEIERAFGCPLVETYGLTEMVAGGVRCAAGALHLWPDLGVVEVLDDAGHPAEPETIGHVVATGLTNPDQPLVRYRTGDMARLPGPDFVCPCGDPKPALLDLEGRRDDLLVLPDGRRIGRLDPVFKASLRIREAQIAQLEPDRFRIRFVPAADYRPEDGERMARALRDRIGPYRVELEPVERIARTDRGKFVAVVSEVG